MRRRVLVANPPTFGAPGHFFRPVRFPGWQLATPVMHPPLWLLSAATALRDLGGHQVSFVDAQAPGLEVPAFVRLAAARRPELAILETCLGSFENDLQVAGRLREAAGCRVILCGPQLEPGVARAMAAHPEVDAVVTGEYEATLLALAAAPSFVGVAGAVARDGSGAVVAGPPRAPLENLDALPDADQGLLDHRAYYDPVLQGPFAFVVSGRGCPHACTFCSWPQTFTGRGLRRRSPARVAADVAATLRAAPHLRSFLFNDDTFTADREHALAVTTALQARGIDRPWGCYARADLEDEPLLRALRSAGCGLLKVGVESAAPAIQRASGKGLDPDRAARAVTRMKSLGFAVHATFAFGLPGETPETIRETVEWACRVAPTSAQFSVAVPYPGTAFHAWLERSGHLLPHAWSDLATQRPVYRYPELPAERLAAAVPAAYRRFYLRPGPLWRATGRLLAEPRRAPALVARAARFLARPAPQGVPAA